MDVEIKEKIMEFSKKNRERYKFLCKQIYLKSVQVVAWDLRNRSIIASYIQSLFSVTARTANHTQELINYSR
jgi:hypothetical protein